MNFSSPVLVGRHLYGLGPAKNLFCVEVETGKLAWSKEGYFMTSADVAHASFLAMGQSILVCTDGGQLVLMAADLAGESWLAAPPAGSWPAHRPVHLG